MKKNKLFYLGLAAILALLITATALYAEPMLPVQGNTGDDIALRSGNGSRNGSGQKNRNRNRNNQGRRGGKRNGQGNGNRNGRCSFAPGILDLTDAQKEEVKGIWENHKDTLDGLRESLQDARLEFRSLNWADDSSPDAIRKAAEKMADIRVDIMVEMSEIKSETKAMLTDEQFGKLEEVRKRGIGFMEKAHDRLGRCLDYFEQ